MKRITLTLGLTVALGIAMGVIGPQALNAQGQQKKRTELLKNDLKEKFVGSWKLVSYEIGASQPMGPNAVGLLTYDADGRMSLQVMRPGRPKFRTSGGEDGGYEAGTAEEVMSAYRGYIAYFGTYEANEEGRFVTHHIEGSLFPNWVGREQIELFELSGDRLTLGLNQIRYIWKRMK